MASPVTHLQQLVLLLLLVALSQMSKVHAIQQFEGPVPMIASAGVIGTSAQKPAAVLPGPTAGSMPTPLLPRIRTLCSNGHVMATACATNQLVCHLDRVHETETGRISESWHGRNAYNHHYTTRAHKYSTASIVSRAR